MAQCINQSTVILHGQYLSTHIIIAFLISAWYNANMIQKKTELLLLLSCWPKRNRQGGQQLPVGYRWLCFFICLFAFNPDKIYTTTQAKSQAATGIQSQHTRSFHKHAVSFTNQTRKHLRVKDFFPLKSTKENNSPSAGHCEVEHKISTTLPRSPDNNTVVPEPCPPGHLATATGKRPGMTSYRWMWGREGENGQWVGESRELRAGGRGGGGGGGGGSERWPEQSSVHCLFDWRWLDRFHLFPPVDSKPWHRRTTSLQFPLLFPDPPTPPPAHLFPPPPFPTTCRWSLADENCN